MTGGAIELVGGFWPVAAASQPPCRGDLYGDRAVSLSDLAALLSHFGTTSGATLADGDVDLSDLAVLLANFGTTCP